MIRWLLIPAVVLLLVSGLAARWLANGLLTPADPTGAERVFTVGSGDTLSAIAQALRAEGLVRTRPWLLVAWARATGVERAIKAGEYELAPGQTPVEILAMLVSGKVKTWPVTLPEGLRLDEVAQRLGEAGIVAADAYLAAARDATLARSMGIEADSFEGYAYPETYRFRRDTPPAEILARMYEEFESRLAPEDLVAIARSERSLHEIVTLASIVEKETAVDEERRMIAAVFWNRLERKMRLQSDPTVIYGIIETRGSFDGDIRFRDLKESTPYNTYTRGGLPPGPIASTTIESIRAVLDPAGVPYLYFVSRNDGTHEFSETLAEHSRAVNRYQRKRRALDPS
jgi:UPF0755 protein